MCNAVAVLATAWCCATPALSQITLDGGEVQVTMTTAMSAFQGAPAVAWGPDGNYVVAWQQQSTTAGGWDVVAQQFQANGGAAPTTQGSMLAASGQSTSFCRQSPAVATDAAGDFVVVWNSDEENGHLHGIFGQLYDSAGQPHGSQPFQVNTTTTYDDLAPAVAMAADGRFLVVWQSNGPGGWSVLGRAFQAGGSAASGEVAVNLPAAAARHSPAVAYLPASAAAAERFQVVYQAEGQDGAGPGASGIVGRAFDGAGNALSGEMAINLPATGAHAHPRIASDPSGNFIVAWEGLTAGGSVVLARRFNAAGTALSGQLMVDPSPTGPEHDPVVAANALGQFVVAWDALNEDGSGTAVLAQAYDSDLYQPLLNQPLGGKVQLNTTTAGDQAFPGVGLSAGGSLLLAWQSQTPAADAAVITARGASLPALSFYTLAPCRVVDTRNANGPLGGPVMSAGQVRSFPVVSACGIPATAKALSVNVTVVPVSGAGFARFFPGDAAPPPTSTVNFPASVVRANNGVFGLSRAGDGSLAVLVNAGGGTGQAHVLIDVNGYFQ
ncbi:MAG TPA: hypothetical protein VJA16_02650 [Thermoanaerobaculia bacterium]